MLAGATVPGEVQGDPAFLAILDEIRAMHLKKSADYGTAADTFANFIASEQCGIDPAHGVWVRTLDKVQRINKYWRDKRLANESLEDSLLDLASYAMIQLALLRRKKPT